MMMSLRLASLLLALGLLFSGSYPVGAGQDPVVVGVTPNNDKGDPFRNAMIKLNKNDSELYGTLGSVNSTLATIRGTMPVIDPNGKLRFPSGPTLGTYNSQSGQFTSQPYNIQIQGSGSTGDVSGTSVPAPSNAAAQSTLSWFIGWLAGTNTVADLRTNLRATLFKSVQTLGYATVGDGGGGRYFWTNDTTTADDGCSVIVAADGGRWKLDLTGPLSPKTCGARLDNSVDDTAAINKAIAAKAAAGGGRVQFPAFTAFKAGGVQLRSMVEVVGPGPRVGVWYCSADPCISKVAGEQLSGAKFTDFRIFPGSLALYTATVMSFGTMNHSEVGRLLIEGFLSSTSGATILSLGGEVATNITDSNLGSNVTWNRFHDITVYGCGICWIIQGKYGSGTASGGNAPYPLAQVTTHNTFDQINLFYVQNKCISIVNAADTNVWLGGMCNLHGTTVIGVANGDDPNYTGNTYVGANKFIGFGLSADGGPTSLTLWSSQNYSSATECIGCESDVDPSRPGYTMINMPNAKSYSICGKRLDNIGNDWLGCQRKGIAWDQALVAGNPGTGFNLTWPSPYSKYILAGSGTLASGTVALPCNPPNGLRAVFATSGLTVTSLSVVSCSGAGQSIYGSPGTVSQTAPIAFRYDAGSNGWFRD
jgi:hypothetical protein